MIFDRVCLINLDKRKDRLGGFLAKIQGIPELAGFQRVRAVHGKTVGVPGFYTAGGGAWGCRQSHLRILEDAMLDGVGTLCVLEDDVCFVPDFSNKLREFMRALPADWDGVMLGGQNLAPAGGTGIPGIQRSANTQRTHAYVVRGHAAMSALYLLWSRCNTHIDHWLSHWQQKHAVYQPDPFLCGQDEGSSDISGRQDAVRFWRSADMPSNDPLLLVYASKEVVAAARLLGLHTGHSLDEDGCDRGIKNIESMGWPPERTSAWVELIASEAAESGFIPALWHEPMPKPEFLQRRIRRPTVVVEANTLHELAQASPVLAKNARAAEVVWVFQGDGIELLEGAAYYGWHRGNWKDEITGLDQGLRLIVERNEYHRLPSLLSQLRREAAAKVRGKVLLAHPRLDLAAVRAVIGDVVEVRGTAISDFLAALRDL